VIVTGRLFLREDRDKRLSRVEIEAVSVGVDLNRVVVEVRHGSQVVA
jgi:hypothetical protein